MELCSYGCGQEAKYQLKNGKWCCSESKNSCKALRQKNSDRKKSSDKYNPTKVKIVCNFCKAEISLNNIKHHEQTCYLNPQNLKLCPICQKPIKDHKHNVTCSVKCSAKYFKEMYTEVRRNNGNPLTYRTICFIYHQKECIICKENIIVSVHHYDFDEANNLPENLIPMCPTHHQYIHSRFKDLINEKVEIYRKEWLEKLERPVNQPHPCPPSQLAQW